VQGGFFEICQLIIDNDLVEKNPRGESGNTPLHDTAFKEVQIVYRLFLVNCYLLHVPRLPSQPASSGRG
jgi:hypothetical protein